MIKKLEHPKLGLGLILVIIGVIWLGRDMGWIPENLPLLPIVVIIVGLILMFKKHKK